jgi:hypothetical protein
MDTPKQEKAPQPKMKIEQCTYILYVHPADKNKPARPADGLFGREILKFHDACVMALSLRSLLGWAACGSTIHVQRNVIRSGNVLQKYYVAHFLVDGHG